MRCAGANLELVLVRILYRIGDLDRAVAIAETHLERHPADSAMAVMLRTLCIERALQCELDEMNGSA